MKILLKNVKIVDARSSHHLKKRDVLVEKGAIKKIGKNIKANKAETVDIKNLHISYGWIDVGTQVGEPGFEHRETIDSVCKAAKFGGYTALASFPDTNPPIQTKSDVQFLKNRSRDCGVEIFPIGAATRDCKGQDLTEMIDMSKAGAIAFSDGRRSIKDAGTMLRALVYSQSFNGVIVQQATDTSVIPGAYIHEGEMSTRLGLKGIPAVVEEIQAERDLKLLDYTGSRMILHNISSRELISMIKKSGLANENLSVSVSYFNLIFHDDKLEDYDPSFKTIPPLRSQRDKNALVRGIKDGTISIISSNHNPQDLETKSLEFDHSSFGNIGLETCFAALNSNLGETVDLSTLIDCLSFNARSFLGIQYAPIEAGNEANLTLFDPSTNWILERSHIQSKSKNTPFVDQEFTGKALGIINNNGLQLV